MWRPYTPLVHFKKLCEDKQSTFTTDSTGANKLALSEWNRRGEPQGLF